MCWPIFEGFEPRVAGRKGGRLQGHGAAFLLGEALRARLRAARDTCEKKCQDGDGTKREYRGAQHADSVAGRKRKAGVTLPARTKEQQLSSI